MRVRMKQAPISLDLPSPTAAAVGRILARPKKTGEILAGSNSGSFGSGI